MGPEHEEIRRQALGDRSAYRLDAAPLSNAGGQGEVLGATHKATGVRIALKRRRSDLPDAVARMRREIAIGKHLADQEHVVPVLDAAIDESWFVMPIAVGNAETFRTDLASRPGELRRMIEQVLGALAAAHAEGWIHRDVKPANILRWADGSWALGDWGLVRGPHGQTTDPNRTRTGEQLGTVGFAAPELGVDAHTATFAADIYSVGQVIGWVLTGQTPQPNVPLLPPDGPWRVVARAATLPDPSRRPQTCAALLTLIADEFDAPPKEPAAIGEKLVADLNAGRAAALNELWTLATGNVDDYDLYIDVLPSLSPHDIETATKGDPGRAQDIVKALDSHLGGSWDSRPFKWADHVIMFIFQIARTAAEVRNWALLEDAIETLASWDEHWDQWTPQRSIRAWIGTLQGEAARIVAAAMRAHPESARHFAELADDRRVDARLRSAFK